LPCQLEQEEYNAEKINWDSITFEDNQDCLDLIEGRPLGILSLLDEEVRFPKASDQVWLTPPPNAHLLAASWVVSMAHSLHSFFPTQYTQTLLEKLNTNHKASKKYDVHLRSKVTFSVRHYAGEVSYLVTGFLDKNKDTLQEDIVSMLKKSSTKILVDLFTEEGEPEVEVTNRGRGRSTPLTPFSLSLCVCVCVACRQPWWLYLVLICWLGLSLRSEHQPSGFGACGSLRPTALGRRP
jgi:hypothetical protein